MLVLVLFIIRQRLHCLVAERNGCFNSFVLDFDKILPFYWWVNRCRPLIFYKFFFISKPDLYPFEIKTLQKLLYVPPHATVRQTPPEFHVLVVQLVLSGSFLAQTKDENWIFTSTGARLSTLLEHVRTIVQISQRGHFCISLHVCREI